MKAGAKKSGRTMRSLAAALGCTIALTSVIGALLIQARSIPQPFQNSRRASAARARSSAGR